jgi:hypothetical protein
MPKGTNVIGAVWPMKRKRRIWTREVYKWKARLNCHGGQQQYGIIVWETYSSVVNWFSIRLFLVISILKDWETRQIDFVLAYPQADVECDIYMEVPVRFDIPGRDKKKYCLKLKKNIYGTKQAGRVWNKFVHKGLIKLGYAVSRIDSCVYYKGSSVFMLYVDDGIFAGPDKQEIASLIQELQVEFNTSLSACALRVSLSVGDHVHRCWQCRWLSAVATSPLRSAWSCLVCMRKLHHFGCRHHRLCQHR